MARGYAGPEDPDKGKPYRHTRAKIGLMLSDLVMTPDAEVLRAVVLKMAERHPVDVLDAVVTVMGTDEELTMRKAIGTCNCGCGGCKKGDHCSNPPACPK